MENKEKSSLFDTIVSEPGKEANKKEVIDIYQKWAEKYDHDMIDGHSYNGHIYSSNRLIELIPETKRKEVRILDLAAGTGLIGERLKKAGFENIDALDGSSQMLENLEEKKIYKSTICALVGDRNSVPQISDDSYDAVVTSGSYLNGHLPIESLNEIVRVIKSGGYFVNTMRESYLSEVPSLNGMEPLMKKLEDDQKWKLVTRTNIPDYIWDEKEEKRKGIVHTYKVL